MSTTCEIPKREISPIGAAISNLGGRIDDTGGLINDLGRRLEETVLINAIPAPEGNPERATEKSLSSLEVEIRAITQKVEINIDVLRSMIDRLQI